jgi:hypothetical protein
VLVSLNRGVSARRCVVELLRSRDSSVVSDYFSTSLRYPGAADLLDPLTFSHIRTRRPCCSRQSAWPIVGFSHAAEYEEDECCLAAKAPRPPRQPIGPVHITTLALFLILRPDNHCSILCAPVAMEDPSPSKLRPGPEAPVETQKESATPSPPEPEKLKTASENDDGPNDKETKTPLFASYAVCLGSCLHMLGQLAF